MGARRPNSGRHIDGDVITGDGHQNVAIVARQDPYGTGLADAAQKSFEAAGGQVVKKVVYDPNAQSYDNEVDQLVQAKPDAILYITFDEGAKILTRAIEKGIGPDKVPAYFVDGHVGKALSDLSVGATRTLVPRIRLMWTAVVPERSQALVK